MVGGFPAERCHPRDVPYDMYPACLESTGLCLMSMLSIQLMHWYAEDGFEWRKSERCLCLQVSVIHNAERCEAFGAEFAVYEDLWKKDMRTSLDAWLEEKTTTNEGV